MDELAKDIEAYETLRGGLEAEYMGKWILIQNQKLVAFYESFEAAAEEAVSRFGSGPYLIRQVGAPPVTLSASVMYNIKHD